MTRLESDFVENEIIRIFYELLTYVSTCICLRAAPLKYDNKLISGLTFSMQNYLRRFGSSAPSKSVAFWSFFCIQISTPVRKIYFLNFVEAICQQQMNG